MDGRCVAAVALLNGRRHSASARSFVSSFSLKQLEMRDDALAKVSSSSSRCFVRV